MPNYLFNHIHHETKNVEETVAWYQDVFNATSDEPFQRGGANWVFVYIDKIQITVTDRDFTDMKLGRYQGIDHFALTSDDFDATLTHLDANNVSIWMGPTALENGQRIIFIDGPDQIKIEIMENV